MSYCYLAQHLLLVTVFGLGADSDTVEKQKATATAHWKQLFGEEPPAIDETDHFLVYGVSTTAAAKRRQLAAGLETHYRLARKALKIDDKAELWPGKLTVYLIPTRQQFNSFMRTVVKQRPGADESAILSLKDDHPYVAVSPPQTKHDPVLEVQAGEQVAAAVLSKHGGDTVPAWLLAGFARATAWRANPSAANAARMEVRRKMAGRTAADVWDGRLAAEEAALLRASLAEFFAYGPQAATFPQFVAAFRPGEDGQRKSTTEALKVTSYTPQTITPAWQAWVLRGR